MTDSDIVYGDLIPLWGDRIVSNKFGEYTLVRHDLDWPSAESYTADFLKQAKYVFNEKSPICQKCLKEMWGCAVWCEVFAQAYDETPFSFREYMNEISKGAELFD